jgi:hypothetical protein
VSEQVQADLALLEAGQEDAIDPVAGGWMI